MTEKYILVSDDEYCYILDTSDENYKPLEDFEKQEFKNAKHDGIDIKDYEDAILESANDKYWDWVYNNHLEADTVNDILNNLADENEQLQKKLNKLEKFEHGGEHIRLSINIETGELQRHIYATGQWFGDFDRVLVKNWVSEEDYQRFINRIIEVYNTEFKKD